MLLIGLDSADAELIEQWMATGHMPAFARLRREGVWGRLGTTAEIMHVSAWPTIYTGTTPGHHGLYHAYQITAGEQTIDRAHPERCGQPPFWKILDEAGRRCVIFDAFMNYPLPGFKGIQILEYGTWTWFGRPLSTPAGMLSEVRRRFGPYPAPEHTEQVQVPNDPRRFRDQLTAGARVKSRIVQSLVREQDWDLMFVTFGEPHGAGHYLWHIGDPEYPLQHRDGSLRNVHALRDVYGAVDEAIGGILEAIDDDTTVIIISGDGMGPNYSGCHLMPEMLHRMGLFHSESVGGASKASHASKRGMLARIRQSIPLGLRQSVSRCLPRSLRYRLSLKWMNAGIDWTRSKVFCIPNSNEGYFRVNLSGREPKGVVYDGAEYRELLASVRHQLEHLVNPQNGMRAAERIVLTDDVYGGPRRRDLPDAVITWNPRARISSELETPELGRISERAGYAMSPFYTGNHRPSAFVLARGPSLPEGRVLEGGHILDLAPTVLSMLGVNAPVYFEGRAWRELN